MANERRFYIVRREELSLYGDERGIETIEEAQDLMKQCYGDDDLVVICGVELVQEISLTLLEEEAHGK